jgi:DNA-binding response OmpR family regulator
MEIICIIEDNKPIRKLFSTLLKKANFETIEFSDGKSALEWISNNNMPSAFILDILLPDQSGTDILNVIRQKPNGVSTPIIAVTGFATSNDRQKYLDLGFDHYIAKPINTASFVEEVKGIINSKK